jgi:hypothetical protein
MAYQTILAIVLATLVYLLVDIYPSVRSFLGIFLTPSFWLLWAVFVVLNLIAWAILGVAVGAKVKALVGSNPEAASLLLIIMATLGTITLLQSFTLKLSDVKLVDIGPLVDNFRRAVLAQIAERVKILRRRKEQKTAVKLANRFKGNVPNLRTHYLTVFAFGGVTAAQIATDLTRLENDAKACGAALEQLLAINIVQADIGFAESLL